ncbi:MAG: hypothetical protein HY909_08090 [Deltaproteobacteria bacterium]|nr:hypothetical protein [Deltaproteobacteria bacterium]
MSPPRPVTRGLPPALALGVALLAACEGPEPGLCDGVASQPQFASAEGRWLLGAAARYPVDTSMASLHGELLRSQRERRWIAWMAVVKAIEPVRLARPTAMTGATVPRFRTWYDREDVARTFQRLYGGLTPAQRAAGERFTDEAMDDAFGWNARFVTTLSEWPEARLERFAASFDGPARLASAAGVQRVAASPDAVRHLMASYPEILRCLSRGAPPDFQDGPAAPQQLAREPVTITRCGARAFGPYFVASGGALVARVDGADAGSTVQVFEGVSLTTPARCTAPTATGCTVTGPGTFTVRLAARDQPTGGMLDVRYAPPSAELSACLHGVFPLAAATVAMEWRRADIGEPFPVYDTSAAGLTRRLRPGADATWGPGDGTAEPDERSVYTLRLPSGSTFRLAGMHLRTREVGQWLNITLWWSDDPDTDFGADRPDSIRALGGPWTSYKMCVTTDFNEHDPDPDGGFARSGPTLAAALRAVYEGRGAPSWCSNPYIDGAPGLVRTNCAGCHQHAMSGVRPGEVQMNAVRYPSAGRAQVRNNFPSDGFWGIDGGDRLGAVLAETVDYYRAAR